ncbi:MAG: Eco57I restriction-modification methylase domain-containing protein, partial [Dolichospermum sp.]
MYQDAVRKYHHPDDKKQKQEMENFIKKIKDNCKSDLSSNNPIKTKLRQKEGELENLDVQLQLLGESEIDKKVREQNKEKLGEEISKLRAELQEIERGKIYQNAFEWRFEFPEVLNKEGDFVGFDVVIENPPYITYHGRRRVIIFNEVINYFKNTYDCAKDTKKDGK